MTLRFILNVTKTYDISSLAFIRSSGDQVVKNLWRDYPFGIVLKVQFHDSWLMNRHPKVGGGGRGSKQFSSKGAYSGKQTQTRVFSPQQNAIYIYSIEHSVVNTSFK